MTKIGPDPDAPRVRVMNPAPVDPNAPRLRRELPDYWDQRRRRENKPDLSRCAAELRNATMLERKVVWTTGELTQVQNEISEVLDRHGVNNDKGVALLLTFGAYLGAYYNMTSSALLSTTELAYDLATKRPDAKERAKQRIAAGRLTWTHEAPTVEGQYWLRHAWITCDAGWVVSVYERDGRLLVTADGERSVDEIGGQWAGPLDPPGLGT